MTEKGYLIKKKVLFIDLDDTIITTISGNTFPTDVTDFKIRKEVLDKIVDAFPTLYYVEIVSNQGGIPQFVDEQDFIGKIKAIESFMQNIFAIIPDEISSSTLCIAHRMQR